MSADLSMLDLFRLEAEGQGQALVSGLLGLEQDHGAAEHLDACMRALSPPGQPVLLESLEGPPRP